MHENCKCGENHDELGAELSNDACFLQKKSFSSPQEKVDSLKKAIQELGFKVEEERNGDIKISI